MSRPARHRLGRWAARCAALLCLAPGVAAAQAALAEVYPYKLRATGGGTVEYVYDLRAVKKAGASPDAQEAHSAGVVERFLKSLPDEAVVRLHPGTPLSLAGAGGLEEAPLASTFAAVSKEPILREDPLGRPQAGRLRPALHPDEPKVLLSADAVLWRVRWFEDGVAAAVESDLDRTLRDVLSKVFDRALGKAHDWQGDPREGALALAARVAVSLSCMDQGKLPAAARSGDLGDLVRAEMERRSLPPEVAVPPHPHDWSPELVCGHVRQWVLTHPFPNTRGGAAAPLVFLSLLEGDPKLRAAWDGLRARRDAFFGKPQEEPLEGWRARARPTAKEALEDLGGFLEGFGAALPVAPGLWAMPRSPFQLFLDKLQGAERANAIDELMVAASDGRVAAPSEGAPWIAARESAWAAVVSPDLQKDRVIDADWRDRLTGLFSALVGGAHESRGGDRETPEPDTREELLVRLMVPPYAEVEPLPAIYARAATSLEKLAAVLKQQKLGTLRGAGPDGRGGEGAAAAEAARLAGVMRGLAWLASPKSGAPEPREVAQARNWLAAWRQDPVLGHDTREVFAGPLAVGDGRPHAAVAGVGRRPLAVGFAAPPRLELLGKPVQGLEPDAHGEQVYLVPVLVTVGAQAAAGALPLEAAKWRRLVDGAGRKRTGAEAAFLESVSGTH